MSKKLYMQRRSVLTVQPVRKVYEPDLEAEPAEPNRINVYTCWTCKGEIITIDRHAGVTPAMLACRATEGCPGTMHSHRYQVDKTLTPEWEWFKPRKPKGAMREHVEMGGLDIRRIEP